jgi:hypothetical protein
VRELNLFRSILRCDSPDIPGGSASRDSTSSQYPHRSPQLRTSARAEFLGDEIWLPVDSVARSG